MLARLLSLRQVVLLCDNVVVYLFYKGKVYTRPADIGTGNLPRKGSQYSPVWGLIDVDFQADGPSPSITSNANIWPIQTSAPNLYQWHSWRKQTRAALLGMPLWNEEELMRG